MDKAYSDPKITRHFPFHYAYVILFISILTVMASLGYGRFGYTAILPSMKEGLDLSYTQMGLLASGNFIGYLLFSLAGGFLAVKFGPRLVVFIALLITGAAMFFTGLSNTFLSALIFRVVTGIGSGGSNIPIMGMASSWFTGKRRGMATGLMVGGSGLGLLSTGYMVPRLLTGYQGMGWRYSWFVLGSIVILIAAAAYMFLRNHPGEINLKPLGEPLIEHQKESGPNKSHNVQDTEVIFSFKQVCTHKFLWLLAGTYSLFGFSYIVYSTFFIAYLVDGRGLEEAAAGNLWALVGIISIFSGFIWGSISDYLGREKTLVIVFLFQSVSFGIMGGSQNLSGFLLSSVLFGLTAWSIPGIMAAVCGDTMGSRQAPAALGFITLGLGVGQVFAPWVSGLLLDATANFSLPFFLASFTSFFGALISYALRIKKVQRYIGKNF